MHKPLEVRQHQPAHDTVGMGVGSFKALVEQSPEVLVVCDPDLKVRYVSPSVERVLGSEASSMVGTALPDYFHPKERGWVRGVLLGDGLGSERDPAQEHARVQLRMPHADGSWRSFDGTLVDLLDDPGVGGIAIYLHDITEERALREKLAYRSFHDPLTGLPNRALFTDRLEHALDRGTRHLSPVTVLFVDLDDFKAVNDGFGHEIGDLLLVSVGRRLLSCVRPGDTVARLGGDEFALLLEDTGDDINPNRAVERIRRASRSPVSVRGHTLFVTSSIGGATGEPGMDRAEDVLRRADMAMYRAKREGKDRFELFGGDPSDAARGGSAWPEHDLKVAFERGELRVHYQPGVALESGGIVGMEALLRWGYPRRNGVPPAEIIALAEMSGLIGPIGRWILEEACRQGSVWQELYPDAPPRVSVNLSTRQLQHPALADEVAAVLRKTGLDPANLALEIEDGFSTEKAPHVAVTFGKLEDLGVGLAVDDFGGGRSSLPHLGRFPVDTLKIDRRFIEDLDRDEEGGTQRLVAAMVGFAKTMGLRTAAEGVETAEQLKRLREIGCELGQGFYFWEPLPAERATELLRESRGA